MVISILELKNNLVKKQISAKDTFIKNFINMDIGDLQQKICNLSLADTKLLLEILEDALIYTQGSYYAKL